MSESTTIKEEAPLVVEELPEDATWSDFARLVIQRQRVEEGIADLDAGIIWSSDGIRSEASSAFQGECRGVELGAPAPLGRLMNRYRRLPVLNGKPVDVIEVIVTGSHGEVVLLRGCRDPDVVFRNWPTFFAKKVLDFSVMLSGR
jgi:hypothetical protein